MKRIQFKVNMFFRENFGKKDIYNKDVDVVPDKPDCAMRAVLFNKCVLNIIEISLTSHFMRDSYNLNKYTFKHLTRRHN